MLLITKIQVQTQTAVFMIIPMVPTIIITITIAVPTIMAATRHQTWLIIHHQAKIKVTT